MRRGSDGVCRGLAALGGAACLLLVPAPVYAQASGRPLQQSATGISESAPQPQQTFLNRYCVRCHNDRRLTAGLALDTADLGDVGGGAVVWEKVVRKLRAGVMPPAGMPRPEAAARAEFVSWLEAGLDRAAAAAPNPGRTSIHRLNRVEYANAVRDLLALDIDAKALLPADESAHGFDNMADVLRVSPGLLERYLLAAKKISRLALGYPGSRGDSTYTFPLVISQAERMSEDLPFGSRGGASVRHHFPLAGEYVVKVRLQRNSAAIGSDIRGLDGDEQIDVWLDGALVKTFTFAADDLELARSRYIAGRLERDDRDAGLHVRIPVAAGPHQLGVTFAPGSTWYTEGAGPARLPLASNSYAMASATSAATGRIRAEVGSIAIEGPFAAATGTDSPSRRRVFVCRPAAAAEEEPCARDILSALARRAYRRPVTDTDVRTLVQFYREGRAGEDFEAGIRRGLERILTDLEFLFRAERTPGAVEPGSVYPISDLELASRLAFFLWSSIPDDELLDLAARGELRDAAVLERQVRRMLADARSSAFIENFFGQWLNVRNLEAAAPNVKAFPRFDENLRAAFQRETELFLAHQLREDRSVTELLTADYTFANERLAEHYGISHVKGSHFRRVAFDDDRRAGLLGHGSILTITSYAHRTSPVVRGKWVLENVLGVPPPAPPENVPPFPEANGESRPQSVRERVERHRGNPVCANCHAQMDPLGFALENFDGIGAWRTTDAGMPIDASGEFIDGATFDGAADLRRLLVEKHEEFVRTLTERLLTYALGRGVEHYDMPAVRAIVRDAQPADYRWSSLIMGIVDSVPFRMRRAES